MRIGAVSVIKSGTTNGGTSLLMVVFTFSLAGGLCKTLRGFNSVTAEVTAYTEREQFPVGMSTITISPMTEVPVY